MQDILLLVHHLNLLLWDNTVLHYNRELFAKNYIGVKM